MSAKTFWHVLFIFTLLGSSILLYNAFTSGESRALSNPEAEKAMNASANFLRSLTEAQRQKATFQFEDPERFNWHFTPLLPGNKLRRGLPIKELTSDQKDKVEEMLKCLLSQVGYQRCRQIRDLEAILRELEGEQPQRPFQRDPELYYISMFGAPGGDNRWGVRLEGHHLSLNFTLKGSDIVSATPHVLGANPAIVRSGPQKGLRILAGVEDHARRLMKSLSEADRLIAIGKEAPAEVEGMQKQRYTGPFPKGLSASRLSAEQKSHLESLIREFTGNLTEAEAKRLYSEIAKEGWEKVEIAWRGSLEAYQGHSYLIHGPSFAISYANFQNDAAHIHSAFRDLRGDFGGE
jgi:hypothetical protein